MAKNKKTKEVTQVETDEAKAAAQVTPAERAIQELESAKTDGYQSVLIIGVRPDNSIGMRTNIGSFEASQYLLSRTSFELFVTQREVENRAQQKEAE